MAKMTKGERRILRHKRIRAKMSGSALRPRLSVFRSNAHLYVQLIDDEKNRVIAAESDLHIKTEKKGVAIAKEIGKHLGQKAKEQNIEKIVFDRGGYKYHGQIKVLAEELRAQGLAF